MQLSDIDKLAALARLDISDAEKNAIVHDFDGILKYIGQISEVAVDFHEKTVPEHHNSMREDTDPNPGGEYTEKLIREMPSSEDGFLKVRQIL